MTFEKRKKTHAYIIESRDPLQRQNYALKLAQTLVCDMQGDEPCGECSQCRRALAAVHPDIILIERLKDDKGKQRREVYVDQIREMSADAWVRPQQAERKVYIITEANLMNTAAQNAALKILEEPPAYAVFILCTDSAQELLPTVRSRCVNLSYRGSEKTVENDSAKELLSAAAMKDEVYLLRLCSRFEALDSENTADLVDSCRRYLSEAICGGESFGLSRSEARRLLSVFGEASEYLRMNVGARHVWAYVCVSVI